MAFEIIKCFFAVEAAVQRFAGGRTKLRKEAGVIRIAMRALNCFFAKHLAGAELLFWIGRGNAKGF